MSDLQTDLTGPDVRLFIDGRRVRGFSYDDSRAVLAYTPGENLPFGRHTVEVVARDDAGLPAAGRVVLRSGPALERSHTRGGLT